jgi:hypothetical protein
MRFGREEGRNETFSHSVVAYSGNLGLLRVLLIREVPKLLLRVLYSKFVQLLGFSFVDLGCSTLLRRGVSGNLRVSEHALINFNVICIDYENSLLILIISIALSTMT